MRLSFWTASRRKTFPKRHAIDPYAYLRDVLLRITTEPNADLRGLLPDRWKTPSQS